jgi:hypothetical protein
MTINNLKLWREDVHRELVIVGMTLHGLRKRQLRRHPKTFRRLNTLARRSRELYRLIAIREQAVDASKAKRKGLQSL